MSRNILILCFGLLCGNARASDTLRIYFATGKSDAGNDARESVRAFLKQYRSGDSVLVTGYADEPGSAQLNMGLSEQRAAVIAQLVRIGGIPAAFVKARGKGRGSEARGASDNDRRAEVVIRRACGNASIEKLDTWFPFNSITAEACVLAQIAKMAEQLDLGPAISLNINSFKICPICREDSTIPPAYYPMLEDARLAQQRKEMIGNYLRERNADLVKVYYHETVICFKERRNEMKDTASAAAAFRVQGKLSLQLSGL